MVNPALPVESEAIPSRVSSVASTPHHHTVTVDAFIPPIISPQEGGTAPRWMRDDQDDRVFSLFFPI